MKLGFEIQNIGYPDIAYTSSPELYFHQAQHFLFQKNLDMALRYFDLVCHLAPTDPSYWIAYAECLKLANCSNESLRAYLAAASLQNSSALQVIIGYLYEELGFDNEALQSYNQSILLDPYKFEGYNYKGNLLRKLRKLQEAVEVFCTGLRMGGKNEHLYNNLGNCYLDSNLILEAEQCYMSAISIVPEMVAAHCNLSNVLKAQGRVSEALDQCKQAICIDPSYSDAYACIGNILKDTHNIQECLIYYQQALQLNPTSVVILNNLANALKDIGDVHNAIVCYKKALEISPWFPEAYCNLIYSKIFICDWDDQQNCFIQMAKYIKYQVENKQLPSVQPFHAIIYPLAPEDKLTLSRKYAEHAQSLVAGYSIFPKSQPNETKIRIGYVSSDFGDHPLSHLLQSIFKFHNRKHFEVYGFALSPNDKSEYRRRVEEGCDFFIDISGIDDPYKAAQVIYQYNIDILVNLNGYTKGSRNEIFALKPGRVQMQFMGFPGTLGADYIPYMITDKSVCPPCYTHYYSEKMIWMPHSYFANDHAQSNREVLDLSNRPTRQEYGLPDDKFIFANFNQLYKIDPDTFAIWMNILKRTPNSVLWLLRFPSVGEANIRKYASEYGIEQSRIIFTDVAIKRIHINRCFLADLCLDTPLYNGHTTGCDLLWSGLPMVTFPLKTMASRVASGLVTALECPEMIASSPSNYEEKAVQYANGPIISQIESNLPKHIKNRLGSSELKLLRCKIEHKRLTAPLFNTEMWVRNLEKGLKEVMKIELENGSHSNIEIVP